MKLNNLSEAVPSFDPDEALPDVDEFREPTEGSIYAVVPQRRWEPALKSALAWSVRRITGLIKERFGLDVVLDKREFGYNSRSGEIVFGWKVMGIQSETDKLKLEAVRTWLNSDEVVAEILNLDDFILEPDWNSYDQ